ncbi:MAG: trypsin-like peptidase domain-containing protein [Planctomycetota bacterium]
MKRNRDRIALLFIFLISVFVSQPVWAQENQPESSAPQAEQITVVEGVIQSQQEEGTEEISTDAPKLEFLFDGGNPSNVEELKLMETRFADLTEKLFPATVNIQVGQSQGSGVVVSSDGVVLTAAHVIGKPGEIAVIYFPDRKKRYLADTLGVNSGAIDSGMLKIRNPKGEVFPTIDLGVSNELNLGQWVMAVGHPGGFNVQRGLVARVGRIVGATDGVVRTDCTLVGGDSGGPLIDMNGDLIGIHSRIGGSLIDNLHVPVDQFSENWDKLAQGLLLHARPNLGINIVDDTNEVQEVAKGRSADKAGIKPGDKIIQLEGIDIENAADLGAAIRELELLPRQKIKVVILRDDKEKKVDLVVGTRSRN